MNAIIGYIAVKLPSTGLLEEKRATKVWIRTLKEPKFDKYYIDLCQSIGPEMFFVDCSVQDFVSAVFRNIIRQLIPVEDHKAHALNCFIRHQCPLQSKGTFANVVLEVWDKSIVKNLVELLNTNDDTQTLNPLLDIGQSSSQHRCSCRTISFLACTVISRFCELLKPLFPFKSVRDFNIWVRTLASRHSFQREWLALCLSLGYETSFYDGTTVDLLNSFFTRILSTLLQNVEGLSDEEEIQTIQKHLKLCSTTSISFVSVFVQECRNVNVYTRPLDFVLSS